MKSWRRSARSEGVLVAAGKLTAIEATDVGDTDHAIVDLDGAAPGNVSDPTGFTVDGGACSAAELAAGDTFLAVTSQGNMHPGSTLAYDGSGAFAAVLNPFTLELQA